MQTRILAVALCLVMVSAFAITGTVSAARVGNSPNQQYGITFVLEEGTNLGTLTVNTQTGHFVANVNFGKLSPELKQQAKDHAGEGISLYLYNKNVPGKPIIHKISTDDINKGGNLHSEGTSQDLVQWINQVINTKTGETAGDNAIAAIGP